MNASSSLAKNTLIAFILFALIHFGFGFILNFSVDEAHYALYAIHPDWSYFDHPPLVGWIQLIPAFLNMPEGIMRIIPETLWALGIWISTLNTEKILRLFGNPVNLQRIESAKYWTILTLLGSAILHVLAVGLLPDSLLIPLVAAMIFQSLAIIEEFNQHNKIKLIRWISLGLILGLSGLSKYTAIFFAIAIPFCFLTISSHKLFINRGFILGLLVAVTCILPILYWNSQHNWISFIYQLKHGTGGEWKLTRVLTFLLNQLLCYGALPLMGAYAVLKNRLINQPIIFLFFAIPFSIFMYMSGGGGSLPHWTSPAWFALAPISGIGLAHLWKHKHTWSIKLIGGIQLFIISIGFLLLFTAGLPWVDRDHALGNKNPIADLYGWKEAGNKALELNKRLGINSISVQNWTMASRIGWYARPSPIYVLDDRIDQFDLWFGNLPFKSSSLLITWSQMPFELPVRNGEFEKCTPIDELSVNRLSRSIAKFNFYYCTNWGKKSTEPSKD